jgi:hypothetical protein
MQPSIQESIQLAADLFQEADSKVMYGVPRALVKDINAGILNTVYFENSTLWCSSGALKLPILNEDECPMVEYSSDTLLYTHYNGYAYGANLGDDWTWSIEKTYAYFRGFVAAQSSSFEITVEDNEQFNTSCRVTKASLERVLKFRDALKIILDKG